MAEKERDKKKVIYEVTIELKKVGVYDNFPDALDKAMAKK